MAIQQADDSGIGEILKNNEKVIVRFHADWCGNCKLIAPKFRKLAEDARFADVTFVDIDAEKSPEIRKAAGVNNLPFFAIYAKGNLIKSDATTRIEYIEEMLSALSN
jgi:thiol-disulfide isomerase/thioredoxin